MPGDIIIILLYDIERQVNFTNKFISMNIVLKKYLLVVFLSSLTFNPLFSQNIVKCWNCEGLKKVEKYIDPYECQFCKDWNSEYRRKVACHACQDTRKNQQRRTRIVICDVCKGSGRDFAKENRLKEFGSNEFLISSKSYTKVKVGQMLVNAGDMIFRERDGEDNLALDYSQAVRACNSLGQGWRLPTYLEMNEIFLAYKWNQPPLDFVNDSYSVSTGLYYYWTSTPFINSDNKIESDLVYIISSGFDQFNPLKMGWGRGKGGYIKDDHPYPKPRHCKCVNTNPVVLNTNGGLSSKMEKQGNQSLQTIRSAEKTKTASVTLTDNISNQMLGWYKFSNNSLDTSASRNDIKKYSASFTDDRWGRSKNALLLNAYSDYIHLPLSDYGKNYSIAFWFYITERKSYLNQAIGQKLISKFTNDYPTPNEWEIELTDNMNLAIGNGAQGKLFPFTYKTGKWYFLAINFFVDSGKIEIYQDDQQAVLIDNFRIVPRDTKISIGARPNPTPAYHFSGKVDDVMIWQKTLTRENVDILRNMK
jgi:hypothetical protein